MAPKKLNRMYAKELRRNCVEESFLSLITILIDKSNQACHPAAPLDHPLIVSKQEKKIKFQRKKSKEYYSIF